MKNIEIRNLIKKNRLKHYEVAEKLGISESTFSIWLRKELTDERKKRTIKAINELVSKVEVS